MNHNAPYDAVLLPGGGVAADGSLIKTAQARLRKTAELYEAGSVKAIVVCGAYSYKTTEPSAVSEAAAYSRYLRSLGIPQTAIYLEAESQDTLGNILFAKRHILLRHGWHRILIIPSFNHSTERISYIMQKVLGPEYTWHVLRVGENHSAANAVREAKALRFTKEINDAFANGDHNAIYRGLLKNHPAYGGTKWTTEQLRRELQAGGTHEGA